MANLYVTQYSGIVGMPGAGPQCPVEPALANEVVSFTTSAASAAFSDACGLVRVVADADCHILVSSAPTATTSHMKLVATEPYFFQPRSSGLKVAAVAAA
jgi:hypothetical protein